MDTRSARVKKNKKPYHYYACKVRHDYKRGLCEQKRLRTEKFEGPVWSFVFGLLKDPPEEAACRDERPDRGGVRRGRRPRHGG